jgi:hypothetical protein
VEAEGFGPWTRKHGALHVAPPFEILADMVTLRVHLDPVPATNAPLLVAPGSFLFGRIPEGEGSCMPPSARRRLSIAAFSKSTMPSTIFRPDCSGWVCKPDESTSSRPAL